MKLGQKLISWTKSDSEDVVAHKIYFDANPNEITYDSPFITIDVPATEAIIPGSFPENSFGEEITYNFGISAVDDMGNESDIVRASVPLDFIAPSAPTDMSITNI